MADWQTEWVDEGDQRLHIDRRRQVVITAVTLLILLSFLGGIFITFYTQVTGQQTLSLALPPVAFLRADAEGTWQLFVADAPDSQAADQLTQETGDVLEFAVSPKGTAVAYITGRPDGGTDVKLLDWHGRQARSHRLLLACPAVTCSRLVWHPDGRRLIIERREGNTPRLWWVDTQTGQTATVLSDDTAVSQNAAISSDGRWLSFADPLHQEMVLYAFGADTPKRLTNMLGNTAVWHPASAQFLFSDIDLLVYHGDDNQTSHQEHSHDFAQSIHLYLGDTSGHWTPLLGDSGNVDDANPAWSPDGTWIAFGRKPIKTAAGRQLWLMRADGREPRALTHTLSEHHGPPIWSPDGRYLLFQRVDTTNSNAAPGIWLLEITTGHLAPVAENGILPAWLP